MFGVLDFGDEVVPPVEIEIEANAYVTTRSTATQQQCTRSQCRRTCADRTIIIFYGWQSTTEYHAVFIVHDDMLPLFFKT